MKKVANIRTTKVYLKNRLRQKSISSRKSGTTRVRKTTMRKSTSARKPRTTRSTAARKTTRSSRMRKAARKSVSTRRPVARSRSMSTNDQLQPERGKLLQQEDHECQELVHQLSEWNLEHAKQQPDDLECANREQPVKDRVVEVRSPSQCIALTVWKWCESYHKTHTNWGHFIAKLRTQQN